LSCARNWVGGTTGEERNTAMPHRRKRYFGSAAVAALATGGLVLATQWSPATARIPSSSPQVASSTTTPIKHVVVIFDENVSYDHSFGTYPKALNLDGTPFHAAKKTPDTTNLLDDGLLNHNPNLYNPSRLSPSEASTCDQNHNYGP